MIEKYPAKYKENQVKAIKKLIVKDPAKYKEDQKEARKKLIEKDPNKYKKNQKDAREKILTGDSNYYKRAKEETIKRKIDEDPSAYIRVQWEAKRKLLEDDPDYNKKCLARYKDKQKANTDETQRQLNFNSEVQFGPIFICSCCKRRLFENGVTKITAIFKEKVEKKCRNFFSHCIKKEITVRIELKFTKSGSYICNTCRAGLQKGLIPAMATIN